MEHALLDGDQVTAVRLLGGQMRRAQKIAPITSTQPPYSIVSPEAEESILPYAAEQGMGAIVYAPMESGLRTGAMTRERAAALPAARAALKGRADSLSADQLTLLATALGGLGEADLGLALLDARRAPPDSAGAWERMELRASLLLRARRYDDAAKAYGEELRSLAAAGCRYVQLDDTNLAYLCDPKLQESTRQIGEDPAALPHTYARLINESIRGRPKDMTVCIHLCRGNFRSAWVAEGGYDPVAEVMFNQIRVDGYFLEYDDARSGDFSPLRHVPKGKIVEWIQSAL